MRATFASKGRGRRCLFRQVEMGLSAAPSWGPKSILHTVSLGAGGYVKTMV